MDFKKANPTFEIVSSLPFPIVTFFGPTNGFKGCMFTISGFRWCVALKSKYHATPPSTDGIEKLVK